eukprot:835692-Pyramimonas_sp.AAC.1
MQPFIFRAEDRWKPPKTAENHRRTSEDRQMPLKTARRPPKIAEDGPGAMGNKGSIVEHVEKTCGRSSGASGQRCGQRSRWWRTWPLSPARPDAGSVAAGEVGGCAPDP